jgi:hypothetical protein
MKTPHEKNFAELADNIRELIEETVDLLQSAQQTKSALPDIVRSRVSRQIASHVQSPLVELMNEYEMTSINALLVWAANEHHAPTETIKAVTEVRFGVPDVSKLPRKDYEEVIKFLIDLRLDDMKN